MLNQYNGIGRLGKNPEMKRSSTGEFCAFNVAISEGSRNNQTTLWVACTANGKTAEHVMKFFKKGNAIGITGKIRLRKFTDKNGVEQTVLGCAVWNVFFTGEKREDRDNANNSSAPASSGSDDGVPF